MRKYVSFLVLLLLCAALFACFKNTDSRYNPVIPTDEEAITDLVNEICITTKTDNDTNTSYDISSIDVKDINLNINDSSQVDASPVYFTEVLGARKRYEKSLPSVVGFEYPYVFYERMSVIVENSDSNDADLYVGRYSIDKKEAQEFSIESFTAISNEARLIVDENRVAYMYCDIIDGDLKMIIELFDYLNNTRKIISTHLAHNVFGYAKKLSGDELVFFLYESTSGGTQQIILKYNIKNETSEEVYRSENIGGYGNSGISTKDIWAIDTDGNNVFLLMHQLTDGKMKSFMRAIDRNGNALWEENLDALYMYNTKEDTVESLTLKGNFAFLHYFQLNKSESNTNSPSAILYKNDNDYTLLKTEKSITPKMLCGKSSDDISYLFFKIHENNRELFAFDVNKNIGYSVNFSEAEILDAISDSLGNLLIVTRIENETKWNIFSQKYISETLYPTKEGQS